MYEQVPRPNICKHLQVWKAKTSNNRFAIRDQRSFSTFLIIKSDVYLFSGVTPITNSENRLQILLEQQQKHHVLLLHVIVILQQPQNVQVNPGSWGLNVVVEHAQWVKNDSKNGRYYQFYLALELLKKSTCVSIVCF